MQEEVDDVDPTELEAKVSARCWCQKRKARGGR